MSSRTSSGTMSIRFTWSTPHHAGQQSLRDVAQRKTYVDFVRLVPPESCHDSLPSASLQNGFPLGSIGRLGNVETPKAVSEW
jgi:hypothetical protein